MNILLKHKEFILGVAKHGLNPQRGNDTVNEILAAYKEVDKTADILAECASCPNIYTNTFKIILAYCESKKWFQTK